ncbi:rRNA cytosine-C5-methyltransferase [Parabacteroides sp. PF5-6]|uniref:methyltransferase RsmF C-terminal domain-like protein n=1 Tax=Parabacteroides sp. PF5-6 TaxID=1742403 RepID=UPI0024071173|nr:rRNA cytosine-C5-methyltransferase [Parabacteroides sp. PF5-6]
MTLPPEFITRTQDLLGPEAFASFVDALKEEPPVSIRINRSKGIEPPEHEAVAWCDTGYYLPERPSFTFDPLFHAGTYYVQEASSMFLEQAIRQYVHEPVCCLDLCAAPGGKSTHLSSLLPEGSLLVSNEVIRSRSHILAENLSKWGHPNTIVTQNDPAEIGRLTHLFDLIVTDVPCSGEGMFRKDPESINEWSVANVNLCAARQRRILQDVWEALKPGGLLIYSTCTYNTEENEENIQYLIEALEAEALPIAVNDAWNVSGPLKHDNPVYRFFPHKTRGEGFFLAVVRKAEAVVQTVRYRAKNKKEKGKVTPTLPLSVKDWLADPTTFQWHFQQEKLLAIPAAWFDTYRLLADALRIVSAGIALGEVKGKDFIPDHALAISHAFRREAFPAIELSRNDAIRYLQKETFPLPEGTEKGYVLLTYQNHPLGFVKNLGNRANNLYPAEWRIRSSYVPTEDTESLPSHMK